MKELCVQEIRGNEQKCYKASDRAALRQACRSGGSWEYFDYRVSAERQTAGAPLLPLPPSLEEGKPTLVLDLDNTLVACRLDYEGTELRLDSYFVARRPGVEAFLCKMSAKYEIVLWTGSRKHYAEAVVASLPPVFSHVICRRQKRLSDLGRDMCKVVMVDDCRTERVPEEDNLIVISHYRSDGLHDMEGQLDKLSGVLDRLAGEADIRKAIERMRKEGCLDQLEKCPVVDCGLRGVAPVGKHEREPQHEQDSHAKRRRCRIMS